MAVFVIEVAPKGSATTRYTAHVSNTEDKSFKATSASLTTTINKSGSLTMTLAPGNEAYSHIDKLTTVVYAYRDSVLLWKGRVIETEKDFYNNMVVTCEGWLSVLMDSIVEPMYEEDEENPVEFGLAALMQALIGAHNTKVDEAYKCFNLYMNPTPSYVGVFPPGNYDATLDYIQENIITEHGGRLWADDKNLYWYGDDAGFEDSYQVIRFGENLLDLDEHIDASNLYTVLIATGTLPDEESSDEEGSDGSDKNLTIVVENSQAISKYGRIYHHEDFSEVENSEDLQTKAKEKLEKNMEESTTLKLSAFDLSLLDADESRIKLASYVTVISKPHGLNAKFICSEIQFDLCNPAKSTYILGDLPDTLTDKQIKMAKSLAATTSQSGVIKRELGWHVWDSRCHVTSIQFYRTGSTVYLTFRAQVLKKIPDSNATLFMMNDEEVKYAPKTVIEGTAYLSGTDKVYPLRVKPGSLGNGIGLVQVYNNGELCADEDETYIVTGSVSWRWSA